MGTVEMGMYEQAESWKIEQVYMEGWTIVT